MERIPLFLWNLEVWKVFDILDDLESLDVLEGLDVLDDLVALEKHLQNNTSDVRYGVSEEV